MAQGRDRVVLVLDGATLGRGNDDLGATLIVNFLRNVAFRDDVPETIVCYNTGVKLAEANSEALPMLQALAEKGVDILLCGTCVDHFKLEGRLGTGRIGDMRCIVDSLMTADKVIYA